MLNRKLLEILSHLTASEKKRLRQFLASPYFNHTVRADEIVRLYDYIIGYNAQENHPGLSKAAVFSVFFPNAPFQEKVKSPLDALTSDLFGLVRRFLAQIETERENGEISEHLALARFYRKFAFEERFWQTIRSMRQLQQNSPLRDARYYFNQFQTEEEEQLFRGLHNSFVDDANLNAVHQNLDLFYSILKLEYACSLVYQQRISQARTLSAGRLLESVIELSNENGPLDVPINRICRLLMSLLQKPDAGEMLPVLERLLDQYERQIPVEKFKNFKAYVRFLWLRQYRTSGDDFSLRHTFDIYREHLEQGYFYYDNLIPYSTFRNLVVFALKLGEFEWVKNFLNTHSPERICGTRYPVETHGLNMAEYYFYLKKYEEAQEKLVYRPFENPTLSIMADMLLVKIYYETQNELLDFRMKALDQKVRRSKLGQETKNRYYNFLKKLDKVIKYGGKQKNPKRARLIEEIKTTPEIVAREWLLEKLA